MKRLSRMLCAAMAVALGAALLFGFGNNAAAEKQAAPDGAAQASDGRELFTREWLPGDNRAHGGDGLGPLFNESSCVACHNQGAVGGAGPASKNVQILTAFRNVVQQQAVSNRIQPSTLPEQVFSSVFGQLDAPAPLANTPQTTTAPIAAAQAAAEPAAQPPSADDRKEIASLHPGLEAAPSVVLHRSATYAEYEPWRRRLGGFSHIGQAPLSSSNVTFFNAEKQKPRTSLINTVRHSQPIMQQVKQEAQAAAQRRQFSQATQHGNFAVVRSERNTTALFGSGQIDAIPVAALEALEKRQAEQGEVSGRLSRQKDDKVGRFGWKAQTASLEEFVLTACAAELGLNVPGHAQSGVPHKLDYRPTGLDMNDDECRALIEFVRELPAPTQRPLADETEKEFVHAGRSLFESVGCAACHVPDVADAAGIFSDLLLHDMGPELGDSGSSYGIFVPDSTPDGTPATQPALAAANGRQKPQTLGATRQEWRTPPLWGVRDSAPYLHDGRAETLEQAIAFHGGESQQAAQQFFQLSPKERFQVITFLKSLVAPGTAVAAR